MSKFKHKVEEEKEEYKYPDYTNKELWELNDLLKEKYNDARTVDDMNQWYVDMAGLTKDGAVIYDGSPCTYQILRDKVEKANKLLGRKQFAVKKDLESLENNMQVDMDEIEYQDIN